MVNSLEEEIEKISEYSNCEFECQKNYFLRFYEQNKSRFIGIAYKISEIGSKIGFM
jgi:hypothetical protein